MKRVFTRNLHWRTIMMACWLFLAASIQSVVAQKWERVSLVSQETRAFFDARKGNPSYPEADKFLGGEGGQWPAGWTISPDGNTLLWGTDVGGVARSLDGGASWEPVNYGFSARGGIAFAIDPKNDNRAIAIGGNSGRDWVGVHGIYLTTNLKAELPEWKIKQNANIVGYRDIREQVVYDPASFDVGLGFCKVAYWSRGYFDYYDGIAKHNSIFKTTDGGETWTDMHYDVAEYNLGILKVHPTAGHLYLANLNGFYKSVDGGVSFTKKFTTPVTGMDVLASTSNGDKVYLSCSDGVYISLDAGENFTKVASTNYPTTTGSYYPASFLKVSPANTQRMMVQIQTDVYTTPKFYSHDGGITWAKSVENSNNLSFLPQNNGRSGPGLWHPTDANRSWIFGGDFMQTSFDGGKVYRWSHNGLPAAMGRQFNFSTTTPGVFVIPTQDYDMALSKDNGVNWKYLNLSKNGWGGYFYGAYSSNGEVVFGVEKNANDQNHYLINISWNGGTTTTKFPDQRVNGYKMAYGDPHDSKIFFAGEYRSTDEGHTWTKMNGCDGVFISSPTGSKELYGIYNSKTIVRSYDKGVTWLPKGEVPNNVIDIAFDHINNIVYASSEYNLYQLFVSTGAVVNITDRVPADQTGGRKFNQVAVDPINPNVVYTGAAGNVYAMDVAVRRSTDAGLTWHPITRAPRLNNPQFGMDGGKEGEIVRVNPWTRELFVGTSCYGTWKIGAPNSSTGDHPDLIISDLTLSPEMPNAGQTVTLTATVKNIGTQSTASGNNLKIKFYIDGTEVAMSADNTAALAKDATIQLTGTWIAVAGSHTLTAAVDESNLIVEREETNNTSGAAILVKSVVAPHPIAGIQVLEIDTESIKIAWLKSSGEFMYQLYINDEIYANTTDTIYTFTNLERYTTYKIGIAVLDETGNISAITDTTLITRARGLVKVPKTSNTIAVDGTLNEADWNMNFAAEHVAWGTVDNAITFGCLWNDDMFYVGVRVMDNNINPTHSNPWDADGIELYIDGDNNRSAAQFFYWVQDMATGKNVSGTAWGINENTNWKSVQSGVTQIPGGYTMEFAIPWHKNDTTGLRWQSPFVGKVMGLSVFNNDNDDGNSRAGFKGWSGTGDIWWNISTITTSVTLGAPSTDVEVPTAPTGLIATPKPNKVLLTWNKATDNNTVAEYFIYQGNERVAEVAFVEGATQSYEVKDLEQNTLYTYKIKSVDENGNVSVFSESVSVTTLIDITAPTAPSNLEVVENYSTNVTIKWVASTDNFGVEKYVLYNGSTEIGNTTDTTFKITGLSPLTSYTFSVKAVDEVANVSATGTVSVTTPDHNLATAFFVQGTIVVDGAIEEDGWTSALENNVTQVIEGVSDNNVKFHTIYDATNLYVAVKVVDAQIEANAGQFWSTDALEVYFDINQSRKEGYDSDDVQLVRVALNSGVFGTGSPAQNGVNHAWTTTTNGYILEMSIPWSTLKINPVTGLTFGFDIGNNDDDNGGGRDGVLMWNGTGNNWRNTTDLGRLRLIGLDTGHIYLTSLCSADPLVKRGWRVNSSFATPKPFTWKVDGTSQTGSGTLNAQGMAYFETNVAGTNTVTITYGHNQTDVETSVGATCKVNLTSMCSDNPFATRRWRVTNSFAEPVIFTWMVFGTAQTGKDTVAAEGTTYFETQAVSGSNTTIIQLPNGVKITKASGGSYCDGSGAVLSTEDGKHSDAQISVYPNPAPVEIRVSSKVSKVRYVALVNMMGVTVQSITTNQHNVSLVIDKIPAGSYVVNTVLDSGKRVSKKVVIVR